MGPLQRRMAELAIGTQEAGRRASAQFMALLVEENGAEKLVALDLVKIVEECWRTAV